MRTISTRTIFSLLFFFGIFFSALSQNTYTNLDKYPKWRLGLNMGGTWQTSDIKKNYAGLAGGFNIERILNRREEAPIGFSLGFRYLSGNSSGYDNTKNTAIKYNNALNGTYNSIAKYDSIPGFFYNNYYTHLAEGNLELKINFPAMEKRTRFIFHVFGGLGVTKFKTRINALDDSNHVYNFTKLAPSPSVSNVKSFYNGSSGTFETLADGNSKTGTFVFTPSLGVGVGFRISKNVAFVLEHKVSFPFTNVLDGQQYAVSSPKPLKNDIYHYTAANLIFTIWGRHHASYNTTPNTTTTTNPNTQTDPNVYTNANNQPKPIISIYSPGTNPYTTTSANQQVTGVAQYVTSSAGMNISVNGYAVNNFTFNPNNGSFSFNANLAPGGNNVNIIASNPAGQDTRSLTINYTNTQNPVVTNPVITNPVTEQPPKVLITYPANNYNTTTSSVNVNANVTNISSSSNIAISANGYAITNFNFNPYNGSVSFVTPLIPGNNSIIVSAYNTAGNDAQQVFVNYTAPNQTTPVVVPTVQEKPVVSFNNPSSSPFQSVTNVFYVTAKVTNVSSASEVSVQYNGLPVTNFTFTQYGFVNFTATLNNGSNTVVVTGTNNAGADTKTATINYTEAGFPPVVKIINPGVNPFSTNAASTNVIATVSNVGDQNNISVLVNNTASQFTYNTSNQTVTIPVSLNVGANTIKVTATTNFGSDNKIQTIERKEVSIVKPAITILSPAINPFATSLTPSNVVAQVLNVSGPKAITVTDGNNTGVLFTYNSASQQITFSPNLNTGANTFVINATNQAGSDVKSVTINYSVPTIAPPKAPTVTIVNPATSLLVTSDAQTIVKATTTNIQTQQEVTVSVNGVSTPFTFNTTTKEVDVPVTLSIGTTTVTIAVANAGGNDSKTQIIDRFIQPKTLLPIVTLITPPSSPFLSPTQVYTVTAEVLNVAGSSDISVLQGHTSVPFTYDNVTHIVSFPATIVGPGSTFIIKGTNSGGSDSKSVTLNFIKKADISNPLANKPVVTITTPGAANSNVTVGTQLIVATVTNVTSSAQVSVLVNGVPNNSFSFTNGAVMLTANLNLGNNTVTVTGTNVAGSDSKTVSVLYAKPRELTSIPIESKPVVIITTPAAVGSTVNIPTQSIAATITNITNASQVAVTVNGISVSNFTYSNGNVNLTANLTIGSNTVTVKGTNVAGSDSKSVSITYTKEATNNGIDKPVVTITTPANPSMATNVATQNIMATVTNVLNASQVSVLINNVPVNNFTFSNGTVSFVANLSLGSNAVKITGTNAAGSDSKTVFITYNKPREVETMEKPVVTFSNPNTASSTTTTASENVVASVSNVITQSQVSVLVNGVVFSGFTFSNGTVTFTTNLNIGNNTITITGTNTAGVDSKTVTIVYNKPLAINNPNNLSPKPVVTITSNNSSTGSNSQAVSATISFINSASQASVTVNGTAVTNFNYANGNVNFNADLNYGSNSVVITGTNAVGSDSKTVTIYRRTPPIPMITITKPTESPTKTNKKDISVIATVLNVASSSEINVVSDNGSTVPFTYNSTTFAVSFEYTLTTTYTTFTVSATNAGGSDSKTVTFKYEELARTGGTTDLITICHYPDGPNSVPQTIQIPTSEWAIHQAHGDYQGACTGSNKGGTTTPKVVTPIQVTPKTTTPQTVTPTTTTPQTVTPQTNTPRVLTPKTITPKAAEPTTTPKTEPVTEPTTSPAPRTLKPR